MIENAPVATSTPDGGTAQQTRRFRLTIDIQADWVRDIETILENGIAAALAEWHEAKRVEYDAEFEDPMGRRHPAPNLDRTGGDIRTDWRVTMTDDTGVVERAHRAAQATAAAERLNDRVRRQAELGQGRSMRRA